MKLFLRIAGGGFLVAFVGLCVLAYKGYNVEAFHAKLQNSLFSGFLTLGGFLLSLKTFLLVQLKKEVFDSEAYRKHYATVQALNKTGCIYAPLKNLGNYLLHSVLLSLLTAVAQFTVGLIPSPYAACFCLALPIAAFFVIFRAWFAIRRTLNEWFENLK